jgi:hypothetical protein
LKLHRGAQRRRDVVTADGLKAEASEKRGGRGGQQNDFGEAIAARLLQGLLHEPTAESVAALVRLESH